MSKMPAQSISCFNRRFTPSLLMILLTLFFVLFFCRLGFWQIERAHEKEDMLAAQTHFVAQPPVVWDIGQALPKQYQQLIVQGHYLDKVFLLDNQHHQHQFGYDVLSPLILSDGTVLIVDRGWIPGDKMRQSFPRILTPKSDIKIQGSAYVPSEQQWLLGPAWEEKDKNITILELLNTRIVSQILQKKVCPFIIRLNEHEAHGFVRQWAIVSMPPQRHLAYAVQWFAMAGVILILFVALNLKKNEKTKC